MESVILRGEPPESASFHGAGYGYGYEDGSGYGAGYGSGYGAGYGSGYGSGYGAGYGSKEYWLATVPHFAAKWDAKQQARFAELTKAGAQIAFWRSHPDGMPSNGGGRIEPAAPGVIHTAPGPLNLCNVGTLHATLLPPKWKGARWWIVALHGDVVGDEEKYGCLMREVIGEAL